MLVPFEQVLALVAVVLVADTLAGVMATGVIVTGLNRRHDREMHAAQAQHEERVAALNQRHLSQVEALRQRISALEAQQATLVKLLQAKNVLSSGDASKFVSDDGRLYQALRTLFTLDELEVIAHSIGSAIDDLGGETLPVVALRLLQHAQHTGRLTALADAVKAARPDVVL